MPEMLRATMPAERSITSSVLLPRAERNMVPSGPREKWSIRPCTWGMGMLPVRVMGGSGDGVWAKASVPPMITTSTVKKKELVVFMLGAIVVPCHLLGRRGHVQMPNQPGNNDLVENHGIGPHSDLPAQVPALRIDPSVLGYVPVIQDEINIRHGNQRVLGSGNDEHGGGGFADQV